MKKSCSALVSCVIAFGLCLSSTANAALIVGDIALGTALGADWTPADGALVTGTATTATADGVVFDDGIDVSSIDEALVTNAFGDYAGVTLGTFVDLNDFVFDPLTPGTQLWTFDFGGKTYSFTMSTLIIDSQTSDTISLEGTGIASITGFDDTQGTFALTLNQSGKAFSFSSSATVVPVPAAVWLFGSGLLGMVGIARRKAQV